MILYSNLSDPNDLLLIFSNLSDLSDSHDLSDSVLSGLKKNQ